MIKLAKYLKNYKKEVILGPMFKIIEAIFELIVPLVMAKIIDVGIKNSDISYIIKMGLILLALAVVGLSSTLVCQYLASKASQGYGTELRNSLFIHINSLSHSKLDKFGSHTLINRLTTDVNQLQVAVAMLIRLVIRAPFLVIGATIMAISINPPVAIIFVLSAVLIAIVLYFIMNKSIPFFKVIQKELDDVALVTKENLSGARVIRAFSKEKDEEKKFEKANEELKKASIRASKISALLNPLTYIIVNIAIIAILYYGGFKVNIGSMSQGEVIALINYMNQILLALVVVANLVIIFTKARASAARINEVFAVTTDITSGEVNNQQKSNTVIEFNNVSFAYGDSTEDEMRYAIKNISFKVLNNQTIGIIGATGSGKSTLINLIPRLYDVTSGSILYRNKDIKDYDVSYLRSNIGIVPQKVVLFQGTIKENILMGKLDASNQEITKALEIAQASEFVNQKEGKLEYKLSQGGKNLSGGQRQRLALARGIIGEPDIIILDDTSSALDYQTDMKLRKALKRLTSASIFIVSQRISAVESADKIIVLDNGQMVGFDTHSKLLLTCDVYKNIYKSQCQGDNDEL